MPWSGTEPPYGFSSQAADLASMQSLYRTAPALRATSPAFPGESLDWLPAPDGCLRSGDPGATPAAAVFLTSADVSGGELPADAAVRVHA